MPDGRSGLYSVFKACERFGIKPPGVKDRWEDMGVEDQAILLSYSQIREDEDAKAESNRLLAAARSGPIPY